jgi:hypothetical protein
MVRCWCGTLVASTFFLCGLPAEEFAASIQKVDKGKVSFFKIHKKGKSAKELVLPASDCKVVAARLNKNTKKIEAGEELPGGLQNPVFQMIGAHGLLARIVTDTDGKTIVEIRVLQLKKPK